MGYGSFDYKLDLIFKIGKILAPREIGSRVAVNLPQQVTELEISRFQVGVPQ